MSSIRLAGKPHHFSKDDVKRCFDSYLDWFIQYEATWEQRQKSTGALRGPAQAKMRNDCGSRFAAFAIWELGVPRMSDELKEALEKGREGRLATEQ